MNCKTVGLVLSSLLAAFTTATLLPGQVAEKAEAAPTAEHWIADLGSDSYKQRVAAERALRKLGKAALPALKSAADGTEDPEVEWRCKRLIRQIESGGGGGVEEREPQEPQRRRGLPDARDQFEDVFRRMERDFGIDIPRGRFFRDDFFKDLDQQFHDMQKHMQDLQTRVQSMSRGMSMQVGPDGVRVEVEEENDDGEIEKKVYEAPDMETFKQKYPDVLERHGLQLGPGSFGFTPFDLEKFRGDILLPEKLEKLEKLEPLELVQPVTPPGDGERLGVFIRDMPAGVREYLELDPGVGLMVQSVQDGSIAAEAGLQARDIVTSIGGKPIGSPADVRSALRAIESGDQVEIGYLRKGVARSATAKKPAGSAMPRRPELQKKPAKTKIR